MNDKDSKLIWENFNEGRGDDPWGETDGERHTREVEFPSEKSLEHLQELLPKLNEDQSKYSHITPSNLLFSPFILGQKVTGSKLSR